MSRQMKFEDFVEMPSLEFVFEVSANRSPTLKQIDELFREIKKDPKNRTLPKQLEKRIQEFTGIRKVIVHIDNGFDNVLVVPHYKNNLPGIFDKIEKSPSKFNAEESTKYIDYVLIVYGTWMLDQCTPRELTAFLLHELGHVYQHTAEYSFRLGRFFFHRSRRTFKYAGPIMGAASIWNPTFIPLLIASFLFSRTLTAFDHMYELDADKYAAKYGYAEEIASVFHKFHKKFHKTSDSWLKNTWTHIKDFLLPDTHPTDKDRVCNMIEQMKKNYNKMYPKLKKRMSIIYADLKC